MNSISLQDARRLAISCQGLHAKAPFGTGKPAVLRSVEQLGYIQIDTISVINRSHEHTLWTRVPSFQPAQLDKLLKERKLLEYWTHAAAYLPMRDYRYCLPYMRAIAEGRKHWRTPDHQAMAMVLERIRAEGPLMARDFEHSSERSQDWGWNWKPAKIALEQLFIEGQLMTSHRVGFQKVYDLPERVLPDGLDTRMPTDEEFHRYLIRTAIRAHGIVQDSQIGYLRRGTLAGIRARLREMREEGELMAVQVEGISSIHYTTPALLETCGPRRIPSSVRLLSPFDNAVIQRKRLQQLFASEYQIECFVPAAKRRFGYYCLPILYGTEIIGRLDPKADRKTSEFIIKSLELEKPVRNLDKLAGKIADKLLEVAAFNRCERVVWQPAPGDAFGRQLAARLKQVQ